MKACLELNSSGVNLLLFAFKQQEGNNTHTRNYNHYVKRQNSSKVHKTVDIIPCPLTNREATLIVIINRDSTGTKMFWISVKNPQASFHENDLRGSFHLAVPLQELSRVWKCVHRCTVQGQLGHMSSRCSQPMSFGYLRGKWTISVHTLHEEKDDVLEELMDLGLYDYIFKYDLVKKFRRYYDEVEYYN